MFVVTQKSVDNKFIIFQNPLLLANASESWVGRILHVPLNVQPQVQLVLERFVTKVRREPASAVHFVLVVVEARLELCGVRATRGVARERPTHREDRVMVSFHVALVAQHVAPQFPSARK